MNHLIIYCILISYQLSVISYQLSVIKMSFRSQDVSVVLELIGWYGPVQVPDEIIKEISKFLFYDTRSIDYRTHNSVGVNKQVVIKHMLSFINHSFFFSKAYCCGKCGNFHERDASYHDISQNATCHCNWWNEIEVDLGSDYDFE